MPKMKEKVNILWDYDATRTPKPTDNCFQISPRSIVARQMEKIINRNK